MSYNLNTSHSSRIVHINTIDLPQSQLINGYSHFVVQLKNPLTVYDSEMMMVSLYSASIPCSMYNIDATQNVIAFTEGVFSASFAITPGWYNAKQLAASVGALLTQYSPNHFTYTCVFNTITGKHNITCNDTLIAKTLNMAVSNSIYRALGFEKATYPFAGTITSVNVATIEDRYSLYVRTNINTTSSYNTNGELSDVLERIPLAASGKVVYYTQPSSGHKLLIDGKQLGVFEVRLTYDDGTLVDLNGLPWELSIKVDVIDGIAGVRGSNFNARDELIRLEQEITRLEQMQE